MISPKTIANAIEAQARNELRRERASNDAFAHKCPGVEPTAEYREGPLPPSHPCFGTEADYIRYLSARERAKYHGHVPRPDRCGRGRR